MKKTLIIEGMSCSHCAGAVTKALQAVAGVSGVKVDLAGKSAVVETDSQVTDEALCAAVAEAGYDATYGD